MFARANDLVARAARLFVPAPADTGLWTISVRGLIVGTLVLEAGQWRLSWLEGTDRRLANYAGRVDGDMDALAGALSLRLGAPVRLDSLLA